jgi:hypothetical protein
MRAFASIVLSALMSASLSAQKTCSVAAQQQDAATVARIRSDLRSFTLNPDALDTNVPPIAQKDLPLLKSALAQTARDVIACRNSDTSLDVLQNELRNSSTPIHLSHLQAPL